MNSSELSWPERLIAAFGILLGMIWTYIKFWKHKPPVVAMPQDIPSQDSVSEKIQQVREDFVSKEIHQEIPELVEEVKENSKDAETAAKALEESQL